MLGAGDPASRFSRIGHQMICVCGCGQILLECNHVGCPDSDRMIEELRQQMTSGGFRYRDHELVCSEVWAYRAGAPIRGGFDNVAWIAPIAVFLMATVGTGFLIRILEAAFGSADAR